MTQRLALFALLLAPTFVAGCAERQARVLNPKVGRAPVVFESNVAASTFEEALEDRYDDGAAKIATLHAQLSQNAFFNREVTAADLDSDGIISDLEAHRYATDSGR
jgi:outer membrane murein-binding lipoprotein Lpp